MLSYEKQLELKQDVVVKAYQHYSGSFPKFQSSLQSYNSLFPPILRLQHFPLHSHSLSRCPQLITSPTPDLLPTSIPTIESTIGSPLQYGYRTKITPHFDAPPKKLQKNVEGRPEGRPEWLNIGFNKIGKRTVLDIEVSSFLSFVVLQMGTGLWSRRGKVRRGWR